MEKLNRICPVCGEKNGKILRNVEMVLPEGVSLLNHYRVVACAGCGFTYADTTAVQEDFNLYYQNANMYSASGKTKSTIMDKLSENRYRLIEKYVDKSAKIVDIGCGSGDLLVYLKQKGYQNLYGIDPSKESVEHLKAQGIEGAVGNIFEPVAEWKGSLDVVISTMVIEHIYDLNAYIRNLKQYLSDKGLLIIDAPAVEGFPKYMAPFPNYFNHEHINYFGLNSLDKLLLKYQMKRMNSDSEAYYLVEGEELSFAELCLYGIYKSVDEKNKPETTVNDISEQSIREYFEKIDKKNAQLKDRIRQFCEDGKQIIIWGTGSYTMQLLAETPDFINKVCCFVDNNDMKVGKVLCGKPIYHPNCIKKVGEQNPILICSMHNPHSIVEQIKQMQLNNEYIIASECE